MTTANKDISRFLSDWVEEFTRAVEMFSGVRPVVRCSATEKLDESSDKLAQYLWWKQGFEGAGSFQIWVGAEEATYGALGGAQESDTTDAKSTYLEMIGQAQQGTATVISLGLPKPFKCQDGTVDNLPSFDKLVVATVEITFGDKVLSPVVLGIDAGYMAIRAQFQPELVSIQATTAEGASNTPMLERLLELELPLSVALGRAVMPIRDVLKVTAGSLIELDRNVGDYVDLVVHGKIVARGEVVSVKGNYGVRVKEIISRDDRLTLYGMS